MLGNLRNTIEGLLRSMGLNEMVMGMGAIDNEADLFWLF